jgi:8-oxo-dGTP pyrophosphatase MutT (NUDIX family)
MVSIDGKMKVFCLSIRRDLGRKVIHEINNSISTEQVTIARRVKRKYMREQKDSQQRQESETSKTIPAVQIVLIRQGENGLEVFLGRRIAGGFLNQWSFPGGRRDEGENDAQAAIREAYEETGIVISEQSLAFLRDTESSTIREKEGRQITYIYRMRVFIVNAQGLTPENASPTEHSEMRWMSLQSALSMHEKAVTEEQTTGVPRSPDKIPGVLAPRTHEAIRFLADKNWQSLL